METIFKNARIGGDICDIVISEGKFSYIGKTDRSGIDLKGLQIAAGLIDIHSHGCMGLDVMDGKAAEMSGFYAENGVTAWLPTTMTAPFEVLKQLTDINISNSHGAEMIGFHLEGPYISEKYKGAQKGEYIREPDIQEFKSLSNVKMVTAAPELAGFYEFIKDCGVPVCIGHTDADYETSMRAIDAGAVCLTHTFNAMPPLHHRDPGVIGAAADKNIYAQVICDGIHIHPSVIRILYRLFGANRLILISDSMRACGLADGEYELGGQAVYVKDGFARLADGTLAGSTSTLLDCVRAAIRFGIPEKDAFLMASRTPARMLGLNKGEIAVGFDADFIVLDNELDVIHTVIGGKIYDPNENGTHSSRHSAAH